MRLAYDLGFHPEELRERLRHEIAERGTNESRITWNATGQPGPAGPAGSAGPAEAAGAAGPEGPAGMSGYKIVTKEGTFTPLSNNTSKALGDSVQCPTGKVALGGGGTGTVAGVNPTGPADLAASFPAQNGLGWNSSFAKLDGSLLSTTDHLSYTVYVVCAIVTK